MTAPATFYVATGGVDIWWRVQVPAKVIGAKLCLVPQEHAVVFHAPNDVEGLFPWSATNEGDFAYPAHEGVAIWTRPDMVRAAHIYAMSEQGILTLAEVDDNYLSPPHLNIFMRANGFGPEGRMDHLKAAAMADRLVCSTRWLADTYRKAIRRELDHDPDVRVCRNHTDLDQWPDRDEGNGTIRVGWMGSLQHARDIKLAMNAFHHARALGCETILMGHDVRDLAGVKSKRAREYTRLWESLISRHIPWQEPEVYQSTGLPFDIGLAPLELNEHTMGKSDVKAVEFARSGVAMVLQNHPVYSTEWRHNETCLLAGSPDEFARCVTELVNSRKLRERLVSAAQAYVREERSNEAAKKEWSEAIE